MDPLTVARWYIDIAYYLVGAAATTGCSDLQNLPAERVARLHAQIRQLLEQAETHDPREAHVRDELLKLESTMRAHGYPF